MATEGIDHKQQVVSLEKAQRMSELYQFKNAELEKVNDQLRLDNMQLLQTVEELTKEVDSLRETLSSRESPKTVPKSSLNASEKKLKNQSSSDTSHEVRTLRKVKKDLEKQLNDSKSSTLSFQASFQAEFDLRTQIEQRLDELRERYERLIMENDQLRQILQAHNITCPSPPGLRSLPGSRRKKHASKARPMTVYSDLSMYNNGSSSVNNTSGLAVLAKHNSQPLIQKASSLHSLQEKVSEENTNPHKEDKSRESLVQGTEGKRPNEVTKTTVMAETAQRVVEETRSKGQQEVSPAHSIPNKTTHSYQNTTELATSDCSREDETSNKRDDKAQQNGLSDITEKDEQKPQNESQGKVPEVGYPGSRTDTLMWNAKGFVSRTEKLNKSDGASGDKKVGNEAKSLSPPNERNEEELKEMLSSISVKQLESAKAFLEASQRISPDKD